MAWGGELKTSTFNSHAGNLRRYPAKGAVRPTTVVREIEVTCQTSDSTHLDDANG